MEIDDTLAEPHVSLAHVFFYADFNLVRAKREFERALELDPNDPAAHQGLAISVLPALGQVDRALAELKRAIELDPFSVFFNANLGYMYVMARRYPEAIAQLHKTIELNPEYYLSHRCLGQALELSGQFDQAISEYEKPHQTNDEPYTLAFRSHAYGMKGDRGKALQLLNKMKELARYREVRPIEIDYGFALAYLGLGDKDEAIKSLERAYETKDYETCSLIKLDPMLDPLRATPRFKKLSDRIAAANAH
jgi:tetratricopeptide (TPR) repeat protein